MIHQFELCDEVDTYMVLSFSKEDNNIQALNGDINEIAAMIAIQMVADGDYAEVIEKAYKAYKTLNAYKD